MARCGDRCLDEVIDLVLVHVRVALVVLENEHRQ